MRYLAFFIAGLFACFFIMKQCPRGDADRHAPQETVTRDTVFADRLVEKVVYRDKPVVRYIERRARAESEVIDTAELIADFFSARYYADSIMLDSSLWVYIKDTVHQNAIQWREVKYKDARPLMVVRETITVPTKKRNKVLIGPIISYHPRDGPHAGVTAQFLTKKDNALLAGVLLSPDLSQTYLISTMWKLSLKKESR